jgi:hypothetical protein
MLTKRQIYRIKSQLRKKAGGCSCFNDGYLQALHDFMLEVEKKLKKIEEG